MGQAASASSDRRLLDDVAVAVFAGSARSRLYRLLRGELGVAYSVSGQSSHFLSEGVWRVLATSTKLPGEALAEHVVAALGDVARTPPVEAEIIAARDFTAGQFALRSETAFDVMWAMAYHRFRRGAIRWCPPDDIGQILALSQRDIRDRVVQMARDWLVLVSVTG